MFRMEIWDDKILVYTMEFMPHEKKSMISLQASHLKLGFDVKIFNIK